MRVHHSTVIELISSIMQPDLYVEIGLYVGETWNKVKGKSKEMHGVDPNPQTNFGNPSENMFFYQQTSDEFFAHFEKKIDLIFIDGDHSYESTKKDFKNAMRLLNPNGMIILHDTDPEGPKYIKGGTHGGCGDCYLFLEELNEKDEYSIIALPVSEAGLTLVKKKKATRKQFWEKR